MSSTVSTDDGETNLLLARGAAFRKLQRMARQDADQIIGEVRGMVESAKKLAPENDVYAEIVETFEYSISPFESGFNIEFDGDFVLSLTYDYDEYINISELHDEAWPLWAEVAYTEGVTVRLDALTRPLHALLCSIQRIVTTSEGLQ